MHVDIDSILLNKKNPNSIDGIPGSSIQANFCRYTLTPHIVHSMHCIRTNRFNISVRYSLTLRSHQCISNFYPFVCRIFFPRLSTCSTKAEKFVCYRTEIEYCSVLTNLVYASLSLKCFACSIRSVRIEPMPTFS